MLTTTSGLSAKACEHANKLGLSPQDILNIITTYGPKVVPVLEDVLALASGGITLAELQKLMQDITNIFASSGPAPAAA